MGRWWTSPGGACLSSIRIPASSLAASTQGGGGSSSSRAYTIVVRADASLFDVSHMGQLRVYGKDRVRFMESLTVGDLQILKPGEGEVHRIILLLLRVYRAP